MKPSISILDCTLRDGGYHNNWDFDIPLVEKYLNTIRYADVGIIEIGFRFPRGKSVYGPFAYCTEDFLRGLPLPKNTPIGVMVNSIDLINYEGGPKKAVNDLFMKQNDSLVDVVRIASHFKDVNESKPIAKKLKKMGYKIGFNLMQIASKTDDEIKAAVLEVASWGVVDILYFADSFGDMAPYKIQDIICIMKRHWSGELGFHAHDNKGMALANALTAVEDGVEWVDGTVCGMGRGAGNARTEYLLSEVDNYISASFPEDSFIPRHNTIFKDLIEDFNKLKKKHKWGSNEYYFLSATHNVHPIYVQKMVEADYEHQRILDALQLLKKWDAISFSEDRLNDALGFKEERVVIIIPARYKSKRFEGKPLCNIAGKTLIKRVWERCCLAIPHEDIYIATDSELIVEHCKNNDMQYIITSEECMTGTDRIAEAAKQVIDADIIINVQGDEPVISPEDILKIIDAHKKNPKVVHCGMCTIHNEEDFRSSNVPKVIAANDGRLMYMSRGAIPTDKTLSFKNAKKQVCIYAFPREALTDYAACEDKTSLESIEDIEILRFLELGHEVYMVDVSSNSIAVDVPEDVNKVLRRLNGGGT